MKIISKLLLGAIFTAALSSATAQQPAPSGPGQPDRKDLLLNALEQQRNDALTKLAFCQADSGQQVARLNADAKAAADKAASEIGALRGEIDKLKTAAAPSPATAAK